MKPINFDHLENRHHNPSARNAKDDLINQIIDQCHFKNEKEKATAKRRLAIACNTAKWTTTDLHALLKKRQDPSIRNYTAFVLWSSKVKRA